LEVMSKKPTGRGPALAELKYFSLDLSPSPRARVKVYALHHEANVEDLEQAAAGCPAHRPGDVIDFFETIAPGLSKFDRRPALTCYAFVEGAGASPSTVTTHFPIASCARNDLESCGRVAASLRRLGV